MRTKILVLAITSLLWMTAYSQDLSIFEAAQKNNLNKVREYSGNVNTPAQDGRGWTPLIAAAFAGHADMVKLLIEKDADVNAKSSGKGETALMRAVAYPEIVKILLDKKADINIANTSTGSTALMLAAAAGHKETVKILLEHKPDLKVKNKGGKTALQCAANAEITELIKNAESISNQ
ncbi:MAG: hypothetical protein A2017_08400 [Lentisphaerae bacterium GWF2_44_16]|nr:MAG: hypothetical protein A2017_08400 [Lentisphaerae bacterium GWF2_44_16]